MLNPFLVFSSVFCWLFFFFKVTMYLLRTDFQVWAWLASCFWENGLISLPEVAPALSPHQHQIILSCSSHSSRCLGFLLLYVVELLYSKMVCIGYGSVNHHTGMDCVATSTGVAQNSKLYGLKNLPCALLT